MKSLLFLVLFASVAQAQTSIPIENPSFEVPMDKTHSTPCSNSSAVTYTVPGWTFSIPGGGSGGAINWTCETPPNGNAVAFLTYGSSMSQDLKILPQFGVYTMKFWVANWFYPYPATYTASLTIGGKAICTTGGLALGDFTEATLVCQISNYISVYHNFGYSGNLGIFVGNQYDSVIGWTLLFDNVSLTFTPSN